MADGPGGLWVPKGGSTATLRISGGGKLRGNNRKAGASGALKDLSYNGSVAETVFRLVLVANRPWPSCRQHITMVIFDIYVYIYIYIYR